MRTTHTNLPSEITETQWCKAHGPSANIYCELYDVLHPTETTERHFPSDTENDAVRELDREALETGILAGKWMYKCPKTEIDDLWSEIVSFVSDEMFFQAKTSTQFDHPQYSNDHHIVLVYTPNYFDTDDVFRVRRILADEFGLTQKLKYKPDVYTYNNVYPHTITESGLPSEGRFTR